MTGQNLAVLATYSYMGGLELVKQHHPTLLPEIYDVIAGVDAEAAKTKASEERTKTGRILYSPPALNTVIADALARVGWNKNRQWFTAPRTDGGIYHRGFREVDGLKDRVGLEVQFGKYSFLTYDIVAKFVIFRNIKLIDYGIEIVPMKIFTSEMSSGIGHFEQLVTDLELRGYGEDEVPTAVLGVGIPGMVLTEARQKRLDKAAEKEEW